MDSSLIPVKYNATIPPICPIKFGKFRKNCGENEIPFDRKFSWVQSQNREQTSGKMKTFIIFAASSATALSSSAGPTNNLENFSPHLSTNAPIVWQASSNNLPKSFRIYRRLLPRIFSVTIISNAIVLGSLQSKGFPRLFTNDFYIWEEKGTNYPGMIPSIFSVMPNSASIDYAIPNFSAGSAKDIPDDEVIVMHAREYASQLGLDPAKLIQNSIYTRSCDANQNRIEATNHICGRGIFLSRKIDGFGFFSANNDGEGAEGFSIEFGSHGQIRSFTLRWPSLEPDAIRQTASPKQIIDCIKAHKIIVLPEEDEPNYFARVKNLAKARKFTITKITPYYYDYQGIFGNIPANDEPAKFIFPMAELEAVADFGTSNVTIRLISPILLSEVRKLLGNETK